MSNVTISIAVNDGGVVNVYNYPQPNYQVIDNTGMIHSFSKKEDYDAYREELQEQR